MLEAYLQTAVMAVQVVAAPHTAQPPDNWTIMVSAQAARVTTAVTAGAVSQVVTTSRGQVVAAQAQSERTQLLPQAATVATASAPPSQARPSLEEVAVAEHDELLMEPSEQVVQVVVAAQHGTQQEPPEQPILAVVEVRPVTRPSFTPATQAVLAVPALSF